MKVLIYPAGTEIGLEVARSLKYQKDFTVIGANSTTDHSYFCFDKIFKVEDIYKNPHKAIKDLKRIVINERVDFLFPTHDQVIYELSNVDFKEAIVPNSITAGICRSKSNTYIFFKDSLSVPKVYTPGNVEFPCFLKPDKGQGSRGTWKAENREQLKRRTDELILEYLPGEEFTIDCFTDRHGKLRFVSPRIRARITNGISTCTEVVKDRSLYDMACVINSHLYFRGQWFFQTKKRANGDHVLMEIAARPAGSSCITRGRGVNLPLLTLYDRMNKEIEIIENNFVELADRALENKYKLNYRFDNVYVDLDDTLEFVIGLVYKLKYAGKKIYLVTKNQSPTEKLKKMNIDPDLFTGIFIPQRKHTVIEHPSIFIDDSFKERKDVFLFTGIPVFDVQQALEVL